MIAKISVVDVCHIVQLMTENAPFTVRGPPGEKAENTGLRFRVLLEIVWSVNENNTKAGFPDIFESLLSFSMTAVQQQLLRNRATKDVRDKHESHPSFAFVDM
jgi:hypothetical protein